MCRHSVRARDAVLDDGGGYHRRCLEFGPLCALCAKTIAPGADTIHVGPATFHAKCGELFSWAAASAMPGRVSVRRAAAQP